MVAGMPLSLHELAAASAENAAAKGFDRPTWENFVAKVAFAIGEVNEARDSVDSGEDQTALGYELADVAIRVLAILHEVWRDTWVDRVCNRRRPEPRAYAAIEVLLWPVVSCLCDAIERWRRDDRIDACMYLELALLNLWRVADRVGIDLDVAIAEKMAINREREPLHGKVRALG